MAEGQHQSLWNAQEKWYQDLQSGGHLANGAKVLLVGTQQDKDPFEGAEAGGHAVVRDLRLEGYLATSAVEDRETGGIPDVIRMATIAGMFES